MTYSKEHGARRNHMQNILSSSARASKMPTCSAHHRLSDQTAHANSSGSPGPTRARPRSAGRHRSVPARKPRVSRAAARRARPGRGWTSGLAAKWPRGPAAPSPASPRLQPGAPGRGTGAGLPLRGARVISGAGAPRQARDPPPAPPGSRWGSPPAPALRHCGAGWSPGQGAARGKGAGLGGDRLRLRNRSARVSHG